MPENVSVLVVDDEEVVLESVRKVLRDDDEHQFSVDTALSASDGLNLMGQNKYDIVVTDLMMPGIDGLQFIDRIRELAPETKVVMITGYATMRTALQALRKGAFDYIAKPFTKDELRGVVKNAACQARGREGAAQAAVSGEATSGDYRTFFNQTYARIQPDGTMHFGVEPAFLATIGEPISIEIAKAGETVSQGFPFGAITNSKMRVFNLRAPLSGRVLGVNQEAIDNMKLVEQDARGAGWLVRVAATNLEGEIENLGS
ncbi:MAG: response regulator [Candidatus Abyssobacteria bacterium SURF_17]|uniref:Response regulator n=1 Tax=Candidatus Abyssobacteria bacterium SURF_17 TaxID=2093361 RepID=A0A419EU39_9BACT|nr:MAG: response regulator [Candidatus Abyssubacteria bacterium SURF_17]